MRIDFGDATVELHEVWQATALPDPSQPTQLDFVLDGSADGDGGFGFSARGLPRAAPTIQCTFEGPPPSRTLPAAAKLAKASNVPRTPKPPTVSSTECGAFEIEWAAEPAAGGEAGGEEPLWALFYRVAPDQPLRAVAPTIKPRPVADGRLAYTATGLPAETPLLFYLRHAVSAHGLWSALSRASAATSSPLGVPPAKPARFALVPLPRGSTSIGCGGLRAQWAKSRGCAVEDYRMQLRAVVGPSYMSLCMHMSCACTDHLL